MINFYKINEKGYPEVGSGKTLPQGYTEFTVEVAEDGSKIYSPVELNDATVLAQQQQDKDKQLSDAKQYLSDTDWVVVKINEVAITGGDTAPLPTKYADILLERENKRLTINQLEANI